MPAPPPGPSPPHWPQFNFDPVPPQQQPPPPPPPQMYYQGDAGLPRAAQLISQVVPWLHSSLVKEITGRVVVACEGGIPTAKDIVPFGFISFQIQDRGGATRDRQCSSATDQELDAWSNNLHSYAIPPD